MAQDLRFAALPPEERDWMASWGLLHGPFDATTQINRRAEREAHERASAVLAV